jgi:3-deoxy-D-manno-octulosonic-acid transferase
VFGPHVWNFRDAARLLVESGGAVQVADAAGLEEAIARLLADEGLRRRTGDAARELVRQQQGATARTLDVLDAVGHATACRPVAGSRGLDRLPHR